MGDVIQIRDYQPKRDLARLAELERQTNEVANVALCGEPGMSGFEIPHYHAPEKDPA